MAGNQLLIDILTRVTGTADVKKHQKAVRDLSNGVLGLSQTYKVYEKGVVNALKGDEAVLRLQPVLTQQVKENAEGAREAAQAYDELADRLNNVETSTNNANRQFKTGRQSVGKLHNTTKSANYTMLSLAQTFQDSSQFSMGFAQGIRAVTNNAQVFVQSLITLRDKAEDANMTMGTALKKSLTGPGGTILLFSVLTATLEIVSQKMQQANKMGRSFADTLSDINDKHNPFEKGGFADSFAMKDYNSELKKAFDEIHKITIAYRAQQQTQRNVVTGFNTYTQAVGNLSSQNRDLSAQQQAFVNIADKYGISVDKLAGFVDKASDKLKDQIEIQAGLEAAWEAYNASVDKATRIQRRLDYDQKEINKELEETNYQLGREVSLRDDLNRLDAEKSRLEIRRSIRRIEVELGAGSSLKEQLEVQRELEEARENIVSAAYGQLNAEKQINQELERQNATLAEAAKLIGLIGGGKDPSTIFSEAAAGVANVIVGDTGAANELMSMLGLVRDLDQMRGAVNMLREGKDPFGLGLEFSPEMLAEIRFELYKLGLEFDELSGVKLAELNIALSEAFTSFKSDVFVDFATNLGKGVSLIDSAAGALMGSLGTMAVEMGKAMIGFATAAEAIKTLIDDPIRARIAGFALVAIGTALKARANAIVKGKRSSSSSSASTSGSSRSFVAAPANTGFSLGSQGMFPSSASQAAFSGRFVISGRDLVAVVGTEVNAQQEIGIRNPLNITG